MSRAASGDTLAAWLEAEGFAADGGPGVIADVGRVRGLLVAAAREGRAVSYSELLGALGHRFTRPKMRAVCKTLDVIDTEAAMAGEPELAVLVVRETDRLPGQGWWVAMSAERGYAGPWEGAEALAFVRLIQQRAFEFWRAKARNETAFRSSTSDERREEVAQEGAGGNPGAITEKGGDPGSGAKSKTPGRKAGGGRSGGSESGVGGNSGAALSGGVKK